MLYRLLTLILLGSLTSSPTEAQDFSPAVGSLLQKANEEISAKETALRFYADESAGRFDIEPSRIAPLLLPTEIIKRGSPPMSRDDPLQKNAVDANEQPQILQSSERLYIFISSSIPLETLRAMAADLARLRDPNIIIVLRGFVGGAKLIAPTSTLVAKIISNNPECLTAGNTDCTMKPINIEIDPLLFRRYGIERVPAIAFVQNVTVKNAAASEGIQENSDSGDAWIVYGDASIPYSIELLRRETDIPSLQRLSIALKPQRQ